MYSFVARENIDRFLDLLNRDGLPPERRAMITKLLIEEEDKLGHDLEQVGFAETRAAKSRERLNRARAQLANCRPDVRPQAERLVQNFAALQLLLDDFCHQLQRKANSGCKKSMGCDMDRTTRLQRLAKAERHIVLGEEYLARQERIIAKLDNDGQDTTEAKEVLATMLQSQAIHLKHRARILRELDDCRRGLEPFGEEPFGGPAAAQDFSE